MLKKRVILSHVTFATLSLKTGSILKHVSIASSSLALLALNFMSYFVILHLSHPKITNLHFGLVFPVSSEQLLILWYGCLLFFFLIFINSHFCNHIGNFF